ncbi:adenylate/guanylate cyclase domain-containing protein [Flexibacterium corallicola]|uniref:adenylate/guanylate cyclase domain-containing protein n=1 Tax=Flexibacterium corallicola TaxID=3037259 RepID=UPI00286EF636|nr:adenylate/guanylate cyclase domain-containing protein [Pseudovibrio sp. M1P-2-3]
MFRRKETIAIVEATEPNQPKTSTTSAKAKKRLRIPIGIALGGGFGLLFLVVAGAMLWFMTWNAEKQTRYMMREIGALMLERGLEVVDQFFDDEEMLGQLVADLVLSEDIEGAPEQVQEQLKTILSRQTSIARISFTYPDGRHVKINLATPDKKTELSSVAPPKKGDVDTSELLWSPPYYDSQLRETLMSLTIHVHDEDDASPRRITIDYPVPDLKGLLDRIAWRANQVPFILFNRRFVLATSEPIFDRLKRSPDMPVPRLEDMAGTPLREIWLDAKDLVTMNEEFGAHLHTKSGETYLFLYAPLNRHRQLPLLVGTYMPSSEFSAPFDAITRVTYVAVVVLFLGVLLVLLVGNKMSKPIKKLAEQAGIIRRLELEKLTELPPSIFLELDQTNKSFNAAAGALTAFSHYVPRDLVRVLLRTDFAGLESTELREMTFFFSDIAGFTSVASQLSAEESTELLNAHFEELTDCITSSGGTIDKYIGDGIMAFWGAPEDMEDHARRALKAVQAISAKVMGSERVVDAQGKPLRVRVGIHTGIAVVGNVGSSERMNYTAIGDNVNIAARLQDLGKQVDPEASFIALASEAAVSYFSPMDRGKFVGEFKLRGRDSDIGVYRIF